jgi:hypothetical protein
VRGEQVVERIDLGIEHIEIPSTADAVLADGGGLARLHSLIEMIAEGTTPRFRCCGRASW